MLSAGHCVSGVLSAQVILGANDRSKNEANQLRNTIYPPNLKLHEDYNATGLQNDVGLIFLPYFNFTIYIQPVLLDSGNDLYNEEFATVSGFGRYSDSSSVTSNVVRYVSLKVITNYVCELTFGPLQDYQMCTSGANKKSSCSGDSGGPLAIKVDDYSLQIGIVSFGAPTCQTLYPAGFSRVNFFKDWIDVNSVADQF